MWGRADVWPDLVHEIRLSMLLGLYMQLDRAHETKVKQGWSSSIYLACFAGARYLLFRRGNLI